MDPFFSISRSKLDEVEGNLRFLERAGQILQDNRQVLYQAYSLQGSYGSQKARRLREALEAAKFSNDSSYQGLVVVISGVLETFFAQAMDSYLARAAKRANHWDDDEKDLIRSRFLAKAGLGLTQMPSGRFWKMRFNFGRLLDSLRMTLDDEKDDRYTGDVFMVRFGTCSPEKIEKAFEDFLLAPPFDEEFGNTDFAKSWMGDTEPLAVAEIVRDELDSMAKLRNDLAHGITTSGISSTQLQTYIDCVRCFIHGVSGRLLVVT